MGEGSADGLGPVIDPPSPRKSDCAASPHA